MRIMGAAMRLGMGYKVCRKDWKDAYLWMVTMRVQPVRDGAKEPGSVAGGIHNESGEEVPTRRIILIKTPTGQGPWTPQPEDLEADDWVEMGLVGATAVDQPAPATPVP